MPKSAIPGKNTFNKQFVFDPEGAGYDYENAKKYGLKPDKTGHWASRIPETGLLLKGKKHPTWNLTEEEEKKQGYKIIKRGNRYYSIGSE